MNSIVKKCPKDGIVYNADYTGTCGSCFSPLKFYCKVHSAWLETDTCPKCSPSASNTVVPPTPTPLVTPVSSATPSIMPAPVTAPSPAASSSPSPGSSGDKKGGLLFAVMVIGCLAVLGTSVYLLVRVVKSKTRTKIAPITVNFHPQGIPTAPPAAPAVVTPPPAPAPRPAPAPPSTPTPPPVPRTPPVATPTPAIAPATIYPPVELTVKQLLGDADPYIGKLVKTSGSIQTMDTDQETFDLRVADYAVQIQYSTIAPATKRIMSAGQTAVVTGILRRDESLNSLYVVAQRIDVR